jgi:hypothetical protein
LADAASRLVLSLFFKAVLGIQRIFHFSTLHDAGLAILTGGRRVLSRTRLGSLVRKVPAAAVDKLVHHSESHLPRHVPHIISIDEHTVPRFTRKFQIKKGYHTIRNKHMPVEKLTFGFHVGLRSLLSLVVTPGDAKLVDLAKTLLQRLRARLRGAPVCVLLDAGAAQDTHALLSLVDAPKQVTLVRTPRRPRYVADWKRIPEQAWQRLEEPGPFVAAPPKIIHITETTTKLPDTRGTAKCIRSVRTIVIREQSRRGPEKDRWHALWIFGDDATPAYELVQRYRQRQHHEQRHRILLHDAFVDTAPSGYDKRSPDPKTPRFKPGALALYTWLCGVATDALQRLSARLPMRFQNAHPRTLRRFLFGQPGELYLLGPDRLLVVIHATRLRPLWESLIARLNRDPVRIPWLQNRKLFLNLAPKNARHFQNGSTIP